MFDHSLVDFMIGLIVVGIFILISILIGYFKNRSLRISLFNILKRIQKSIREIQSSIHALQVNLRQNQILNREPYLSRVTKFTSELSRLEIAFNATKDQYIRIQEKITRWENRSKLSALFSYLTGSEFFQLKASAGELLGKIETVSVHLAEVSAQTREIAELGWEVTSRIREISEKYHIVHANLQNLEQHHIHGKLIDDARKTINQVSQKIISIPQELIKYSKVEVIQNIDHETICDVYEIYVEISPILDNVSNLIDQYWADFLLTKEKIINMQTALSHAQQLMIGSSEKIALGNILENLKTIQSIGDILSDTLNRVEIESLPEMMHEADRIQHLVTETTDNVKQARRNQSILEPLLEQITSEAARIDNQITQLRNHPVFAVTWDESAEQKFSIDKRKNEIIVVDKLRTPDEIQNHLTLALELYKDIVELSSRVKHTAVNHEALISLYHTEEINQGLYWSQEAKRILEQAGKYNQANFPKNLPINELAQYLDAIQKKHQIILQELSDSEIRQSMIPAYLVEMRSLHNSYAFLREQISEVKSYLTLFREEEHKIHEILQKNQALINQLIPMINSNPLLIKQGAEREINRLKKNLDSLFRINANISEGTIEKKRLTTQAFDHRVELACNRWAVFLDKDIEELKKKLQEKVARLENILNLDDVIIFQARNLLSQADVSKKTMDAILGDELVKGNPVLKLKSKNDLWHNLVAVTNELTETIEIPIIEAYQAALMQKEFAQKQILMAAEHIPEKRSWPPTSYTMSSLKSEFSVIDAIWDKKNTQSMRAIIWVKKLGELSIKYQEFIIMAMNAIELCRYERQVIAEMEDGLEAINQKWSLLEQNLGDNRLAAASIRAIKREYVKQYHQIKRRWQFSGNVPGLSPSFEEIKNSLFELSQRFQNAVATIKNTEGELINYSILEREKTNLESSEA